MRLFGLIGYPLSHSFSAKYFKKKFAIDGIIDADYRLFPLENIAEIMSLINLHPDLQGLNITIPHKVDILPYLDHISKEAFDVGAVNCIKIDRNISGEILIGYNTDIYGFRESLVPKLKPVHQKALILGTGGASKAVCYTLQELGIAYTLVSRSNQNETTIQYSELTEKIIKDNLLIINTTPVGMYPDTNSYPAIPYEFIGTDHLLFDLVYNPAETRFLKLGRKAGASTMNGVNMLDLQAEKSWEIWNE